MHTQSLSRYLVALCAFGALALVISRSAPLVADDAAGWVELLEKGDITKNWTTKGNWVTGKDGDVNLEPRAGESGWQRYDAYLWSKEQYKDFEVDFEYKVANGSNSGFYFHVGDQANPVADGIEVQIYDSHPKGPEGKLNDHDSGGIIPGVPPIKNAAKPAGEWNHFHITCIGNKLTVKLNDVVVNEVDISQGALGSRKPTGFIGFQDHGLPLGLRKIKVKKL